MANRQARLATINKVRRDVQYGRGYPPPRVFCEKRLDLLDCKGVDFFGDAKEAARL